MVIVLKSYDFKRNRTNIQTTQMAEDIDPNLAKLKEFKPPDWASPGLAGSYLSIIKDGECVEKVSLDGKEFYIFGRIYGDVLIQHESCSGVHAALFYHSNLSMWFIIDLSSTHGTFVGNTRIEAEKLVALDRNLTFRFAASTRLYYVRLGEEDPLPPQPIQVEPKQPSVKTSTRTHFFKGKHDKKRKGRVQTISASKKDSEPEYFDYNLIPGDYTGRFEYMSNTYILESRDSHNNRQVMLKAMKQKKKDRSRFDQKRRRISSAPDTGGSLPDKDPNNSEANKVNLFKALRR